jgi:hypothetical protein
MKSKTKLLFAVFILASLFVGQFASAAFVTCGGHNADGTIQKECELSDLILTVIHIINYLFALASFVAMVFIVWGAYGMITAGGDEEKISGSKTVFSQAVIGFFLVLVSFLLIDAIVSLLGGYSLKQLFDIAVKLPF